MIPRAAPWRQACLLVLAAVLLAVASAAAEPAADEVAARVNGVIIGRESVRAVVKALAETMEEPSDAKQLEKLTRDALDSLIAFELLYQESQKRKVMVTDGEVDADVDRTRARFGSAEAYSRALAEGGMDAEELRRDTRKTLAVNRLLELTVWQGMQITPEQVKQFYETSREQFRRDAEVRASHILIRAGESTTPTEQSQARRQAEGLLAEIRGGRDFAELARERSQDVLTASNGGDLGYFPRGTMGPEIEKVAFGLQPGQVGELVQSPYGFHIIKVSERRPAGYAPLSEVQDSIVGLLRDEEKRRRQDGFVETLVKQAKIEILPLLAPTPRPKP
jgi:peptidyl-prolyl cis-trans isomerase C